MRHRLALMAVDLCLIAVATVFAQLLRDNLETRFDQLLGLVPYLALTLVLAVPVLLGFGLNRSIWRLSAMTDYLRIVGSAMAIVITAVALGFLINRLEGVARSLPIIQSMLIVCGLAGVRIASRLHHARRNRGTARLLPISDPLNAPEIVLLVGVNTITDLYLRTIAEFAARKVRVAGILATKQSQIGRLLQEHRILGTSELIGTILRDLEVHGVLVKRIVLMVAFDSLSPAGRDALLDIEKSSDIKLELFAENIGMVGRAADARAADAALGLNCSPVVALAGDAHNLPTLTQGPYWRIKRALDVAVAVCGLVLASPLLLCVAILVAVTAGFPLMFWQFRPGAGGRPFKLLKFRTMAAAHDSSGARIDDRERESGVGRVLRRFRLDELPQLYNVLKGEMSLIGPRPLLPVDQCPALPARLAIRPGLTGWAQVKGGRDLSASDKAALDVWYVKHASLGLDLVILFYTVRMIAFGERTDARAIRQAWRELGSEHPGQFLVAHKANYGAEGQRIGKRANAWRSSASLMPVRRSA